MFGTKLSCLKSISALPKPSLWPVFSPQHRRLNLRSVHLDQCILFPLSPPCPHTPSPSSFFSFLSLFLLSGGLSDIPRLPLSSLCSQGWRLALNLSSSCFSLWLLLPGLAWISKSSFIYLEWSQNYIWSLLGWEGKMLTILNTKPQNYVQTSKRVTCGCFWLMVVNLQSMPVISEKQINHLMFSLWPRCRQDRQLNTFTFFLQRWGKWGPPDKSDLLCHDKADLCQSRCPPKVLWLPPQVLSSWLYCVLFDSCFFPFICFFCAFVMYVVCICAGMSCAYHGPHVEVRGQFGGVEPFFPCWNGFWTTHVVKPEDWFCLLSHLTNSGVCFLYVLLLFETRSPEAWVGPKFTL